MCFIAATSSTLRLTTNPTHVQVEEVVRSCGDLSAAAPGSKADAGGTSTDPASAADCAPPVVVVGGAVADLICQPNEGTALLPRTSTPGQLTVTSGGVARNIAEGLARCSGALRRAAALLSRGSGPCSSM